MESPEETTPKIIFFWSCGLWERVEMEWPKIESEECQKLIESIPRRVDAVIKAKGGSYKALE